MLPLSYPAPFQGYHSIPLKSLPQKNPKKFLIVHPLWEKSAWPWFRTVTSQFDKQNFTYISGIDVFFIFSCRRPFSAWKNEEPEGWRMWRDWQKKARFQLTSYPYTSVLHRKHFILPCPFFAFLEEIVAVFQRSRCKDTNFIFGTVRIRPQMSANVRKCPFLPLQKLANVAKNQ